MFRGAFYLEEKQLKKDAYYFPHFCNAKNDRKILRVRKELGIEGYGIYFMLLEVLREQTGFKYPMEDIDLLADDFGTSEQKVRTVITNYSLFRVDKKDFFISPKLIEYLKPYFKMKAQRSLAGKKSAEKRKMEKATTVERELNENQQSKGNKSKLNKVKESKEYISLTPKIKVTETEHKKLIDQFGESKLNRHVENMQIYLSNPNSRRKSYKCYYRALLDWDKREWNQKENSEDENVKMVENIMANIRKEKQE